MQRRPNARAIGLGREGACVRAAASPCCQACGLERLHSPPDRAEGSGKALDPETLLQNVEPDK